MNALPPGEAELRLLSCCGSSEWARRMAAARPFGDSSELSAAGDRIWRALSEEDWLEAFAAHPKIGAEDVAGTGPAGLHPPQSNAGFNLHPPQSSRSRAWSRDEQSGTKGASPETLANLADANREYEERFGRIFIVCASGKNAGEMLQLLEARLHNDARAELAVAAEEQLKILQLRLGRLLSAEEE